MPTLTIEAKVLGQKRPIFTDFHLPLPPDASDGGRMTLRDLITRIVQHEVAAFQQRQEERRLARVLSPADIAKGTQRGKIDSGEREPAQLDGVDAEAAVSIALQAFEDGLYYVFLDEVQQESLEQTVFVGEDSRVMFLRLVALAGG